MDFATYARRRFAAALTPAWWAQAPYAATVEPLRICTSDGVELGAMLFKSADAAPVPGLLIIGHGFGANQSSLGIVWLAESLASHWDVLTFDWRGYGLSGGAATFGTAEQFDLLALIEYGRAAGYRRIGLISESMGGLMSLAALGSATDGPLRHTVKRIATLGAPGDYGLSGWPRPFFMRHLAPQEWARPISQLLGFRMGRYAATCALDVVGQISLPLLLVHGTHDSVVPVLNAEMLHARAPTARLRLYEGVGHGVEAMRMQVPQALLADLREFFAAM